MLADCPLPRRDHPRADRPLSARSRRDAPMSAAHGMLAASRKRTLGQHTRSTGMCQERSCCRPGPLCRTRCHGRRALPRRTGWRRRSGQSAPPLSRAPPPARPRLELPTAAWIILSSRMFRSDKRDGSMSEMKRGIERRPASLTVNGQPCSIAVERLMSLLDAPA